MKTSCLIVIALLAAATGVQAQPAPATAPAAPPSAPPRAKGPPLALALEAAQVAVATCLANGYKTTALITDSAGVPVALLSQDGAAARTMEIGPTKIAATLKYKMPSGEVADKATADPAFGAEVKADPKIGVARRGALPVMAEGQIIGAFAVSGAPSGEKDEVCVRAGLDRIAARLK